MAMRRREFIAGLVGAAAWPLVGRAQQRPAKAHIGWLTIAPHPFISAFRDGMRSLGYVEGENLTIELRYADSHAERLPKLAAEIARDQFDVIVVSGSGAFTVARRAITATPVVAIASALGMGGSLARPTGNITGIALLYDDITVKWLELLHEAAPVANPVGILLDPAPASQQAFERLEFAARVLNTKLVRLDVAAPEELDAAFARAASERIAGFIETSSPMFAANARRIVEAVARARVPAIYEHRDFVEQGGLLSYGPDLTDALRHAATYVDKILRGTKPSELPIERPTKFELVINLKTAKALGLEIPPQLLARADEVIE
jgi:putative tryptophan/tyrosine transport system substrate-binding protein